MLPRPFQANNPKLIFNDFRFKSTIDPRDAVGLCHIPSSEEIKEVIKGMGSTKALGPDGFPLIFFQSGWSIVKEDIVKEEAV